MEMILRRTGWVLMLIAALLLSLVSTRYFQAGMPDAHQPEIYIDHVLLLRTHIFFGIVAVLAGPWQFWTGFRDRFRNLHKAIGLTYLTSVSLSSIGGLLLAPITLGGFTTHFGFGLLAILWGTTTTYGYTLIRKRNWRSHREWMIRSYALCFAFVMLRIWYPGIEALGASNVEAYQTAAWMCWVPNLMIAELYIGWYRQRHA
jgi:uncharacterized membrane protein YozB (DUF420 family)